MVLLDIFTSTLFTLEIIFEKELSTGLKNKDEQPLSFLMSMTVFYAN